MNIIEDMQMVLDCAKADRIDAVRLRRLCRRMIGQRKAIKSAIRALRNGENREEVCVDLERSISTKRYARFDRLPPRVGGQS